MGHQYSILASLLDHSPLLATFRRYLGLVSTVVERAVGRALQISSRFMAGAIQTHLILNEREAAFLESGLEIDLA
jgi:hypothetical protein